MLTVKPDLQKSRLCKQLLAAAEEYINDQWRQYEIEITVIKQRAELISWYERLGYFISDETRPSPYDDPKFGIPKIKGLEFVVLKKP